jgi:serine/threonine protein kinase
MSKVVCWQSSSFFFPPFIYVLLTDICFSKDVLVDKQGNIKITDFGFANVQDPSQKLKTFCGSPMYAPPEIFIGVQYEGQPVDAWSIGVLLFTMCCGAFPWKSRQADYNLMREVINGRFSLPDHLSDDVKALIQSLLKVEPASRATAAEALQHPWLNPDDLPKLSASQRDLGVASVDQINEAILDQLVGLGFDRDEAIAELTGDKKSIAAAAYNLLLEQAARLSALTKDTPAASSSSSSSKSPSRKKSRDKKPSSSEKSSSRRRRKKKDKSTADD